MDAELVPVWGTSEGDCGIYDLPSLLRSPGFTASLCYRRLRECHPEGRKEGILAWWIPGRAGWEPFVRPKVALMLSQSYDKEAPHEQVMVSVVPGVLYVKILEYMTVCPRYVSHPIPHLMDATEHDPCLVISHGSALPYTTNPSSGFTL